MSKEDFELCMRCQISFHSDKLKLLDNRIDGFKYCSGCLEIMKKSNIIGYIFDGKLHCDICIGGDKEQAMPIFNIDRKNYYEDQCTSCGLTLYVINNEVGKCPYCKSGDIEYEDSGLENNQYYYPLTCNSCGKSAKEWYNLEYIETIGYARE